MGGWALGGSQKNEINAILTDTEKLTISQDKLKQAGAELGRAQVKVDDVVVVVVDVVVKAMVNVEFQLLFRVGGWWVVG